MTSITEALPGSAAATDAELVTASRGGDREAFGQIVQRYQRLLCSLAYSATGGLAQSEDLAQDAFLDAWRQLGSLREPEKLRPWLCGILRFKVSRLRRSDRTEPIHQAEALEDAEEMKSADEPAWQVASQKEEQAILWSALERLPETYREPLVLYYREDRSVEHVAVALDLSEDAVKQRLARGRKILQEQVLSLVESCLARSTPGRVFTLGVLLALPNLAPPAKAAGIGVAAGTGGLLAKTTGLSTLLASVSGLVSAALALRTHLDQARTPRERHAVVKVTVWIFLGALGFLVLLYLLSVAAIRWPESRMVLAGVNQLLVLAFVAVWPVAMLCVMRRMRELRSAERSRCPELFCDPIDQVGSAAGEYKSRTSLLGVPLVHCRFSTPDAGAKPVFGWIALGERAYGLLIAWGGYAVAPISIGAVSLGFLSVGSLSFGVISLGTVSVGLLAVGCASVGLKAFAWLTATGWETAQSNGFAIARTAAKGPVALARHANDSMASALLADPDAERNQMIILALITVFSLLPVIYYARAVRQRLGSAARVRGHKV